MAKGFVPPTTNTLRLGRAVRQAGIDPRVWMTGARIGTEGNTVRWDSELGWVVDAIGYGGGLGGDTIVARIANNHPNEFIPYDKDCELMIAVPEGDVSGIPVVLGTLNNADGCEAPGNFAGLDVDGSLDLTPPLITFDSEFGLISPYDHELKKSPHNRREEYDGYVLLKASDCVFEGDQIRLADRTASASFIRGEDFIDALVSSVQDLIASYQYTTSLGVATNVAPGTIPLPPTNLPTTVAAEAMKASLTATLSTRIKGE